MQPDISRSNVQVTTLEPYGVIGDILDISGQQSVTFLLNGSEFTHSFLVYSLPAKTPGLLGTDFKNRLGAKVDFKCGKMLFTDINKVPHVNSVSSTGHVALTEFFKGEGERSPPSKIKEAWHRRAALSQPFRELARPQDK